MKMPRFSFPGFLSSTPSAERREVSVDAVMVSSLPSAEGWGEGTLLPLDETPYVRLGWIIILFGVLGFFIWAALAPLDKGVPVAGTVTVSGSRKTMQHPVGGQIDDILVRDGDVVAEGQVLLRMNETQLRTEADSVRLQYFMARAAEARLLAESDSRSIIVFPQELQSAVHKDAVAAMAAEQQLFRARRAALHSELAGLDEVIQGYGEQLQGLRQSGLSGQKQIAALDEQLSALRELAKEGYVARNRLLDMERQYALTSGSVAEGAGRLGQLQNQLLELRLRRQTRIEEYQKEVRAQLAEARVRAETLGHRLHAADFALANTQVKAPVAGTVVGLSVFTAGGFVHAGMPLMDIVPRDGELTVEGRVPVELIDKVHVGLPVELMMVAFNQSATPRLEGVVSQVSADRLVDEKSGIPYYRVDVSVTPETLSKLKGQQLRPGMPVQLFILTGERTLLSYLFKPLLDRTHTALAEE